MVDQFLTVVSVELLHVQHEGSHGHVHDQQLEPASTPFIGEIVNEPSEKHIVIEVKFSCSNEDRVVVHQLALVKSKRHASHLLC